MNGWELFKELVKRLMWSRTMFYAFLILFTVTVVCLLIYLEFCG